MVELIPANEKLAEFLDLVKEYTNTILLQDEEVGKTLASQHLDDELKDIEKKYGWPYGRMYIALCNGEVAGSVALTKNDESYCEIKRLYVRPEFKGKKISRILTEKVIDDARSIGYRYMRLDTFPFMESAIRLYESYGFRYVERYNDNPANNAIFMELTL